MNRTLLQRAVMVFKGKTLRECCERNARRYPNAPFASNCLGAKSHYHVRGKGLPYSWNKLQRLMRESIEKFEEE